MAKAGYIIRQYDRFIRRNREGVQRRLRMNGQSICQAEFLSLLLGALHLFLVMVVLQQPRHMYVRRRPRSKDTVGTGMTHLGLSGRMREKPDEKD